MAFQKKNAENETANINYTRISVILRILVTLFVESVICVILGYGGYLVHKGAVQRRAACGVHWLFQRDRLADHGGIGADRHDLPRQCVDAPYQRAARRGGDGRRPAGCAAASARAGGGVEFRNLTFRYPDGEYDVLENVSFSIGPARISASWAKTGCGKTTLVDLILRTYNVPDGTLFSTGMT